MMDQMSRGSWSGQVSDQIISWVVFFFFLLFHSLLKWMAVMFSTAKNTHIPKKQATLDPV